MNDASQRVEVTRREALRLFGASVAVVSAGGVGEIAARVARPGRVAGAARAAAAGQLPACVVRPEQTEGPYFVDEMLRRSDIRSDPGSGAVKQGAPLFLTFLVGQIVGTECWPLEGAIVDVWQCDADGAYSDVAEGMFDTRGQKFLRGFQETDSSGVAEFVTIYPGWYPGRTVHIHFKIRTDPGAALGHEFTSQLYFDDALSDQVLAQAPYAGRGQRNTRNGGDGIFSQGGNELLLAPTPEGDGYRAVFDVALELDDVVPTSTAEPSETATATETSGGTATPTATNPASESHLFIPRAGNGG